MESTPTSRDDQQPTVNAYFQAHAGYWRDVYAGAGVDAAIYRERSLTVLDFVDDLGVTTASRALEIGCGAGLLAVALAERGLQVEAIDSADAMVEQTRRNAREAGVDSRVSVGVGDIQRLRYGDETFDLVIAIGVIPWLGNPRSAIEEMARVTKPGGAVILTADNWPRLDHLLDLWLNPVIRPIKRYTKSMVEQRGWRRRTFNDLEAHNYRRSFIDQELARVGLVKVKSRGLGFGPFSLFRRKVLPEPLATKVHHRLQRLADQGLPGLRSSGAQYVVMARKSTVPRRT